MMLRTVGPLFLSVLVCTHSLAAQFPDKYQSIRTETRPAAEGNGMLIYVQNLSDVPVIMTGIALRNCVNTRGNCGLNPIKVRIPAGGSEVVLHVYPRDPSRRLSFGFNYTYQADRPRGTGIAADTVDDPAKATADSIGKSKFQQMLDAAAKRANVTLVEETYDSLTAFPRVLELSVGETVDLATAIELRARSESGKELPVRQLRFVVEAGADLLTVSKNTIRGEKVGNAVMVFTLGLPADANGNVKGTVRVPVHVLP